MMVLESVAIFLHRRERRISSREYHISPSPSEVANKSQTTLKLLTKYQMRWQRVPFENGDVRKNGVFAKMAEMAINHQIVKISNEMVKEPF